MSKRVKFPIFKCIKTMKTTRDIFIPYVNICKHTRARVNRSEHLDTLFEDFTHEYPHMTNTIWKAFRETD